MSDAPKETPAQEIPAPTTTPETSQGTPEGASEASFTQAELDKIVGERAKRAKESAQSQFLTDLGVDSFDSIKALLDDAKKRKEAEMSEVDKALATADAERKKALETQSQLEALKSQIVHGKRKGAFEAAIRSAGGSQEEQLFILVQAQMSDELLSAFDEDATVNTAKMEALVKQVQSAYGNYFATSGAGNPSKSNGVSPTSFTQIEKETEAEINKRFGRL